MCHTSAMPCVAPSQTGHREKELDSSPFECSHACIRDGDNEGGVPEIGISLKVHGAVTKLLDFRQTRTSPQAIQAVKAGRIDFRVDKAGNLHTAIGKTSFSEEQIAEKSGDMPTFGLAR